MENDINEMFLMLLKSEYYAKVNEYEVNKNYIVLNEKLINIRSSSVQKLKVIGLVEEGNDTIIDLIEQIEIAIPPMLNCIFYTKYDLNKLSDKVYSVLYSNTDELKKDDYKIIKMKIKQIE